MGTQMAAWLLSDPLEYEDCYVSELLPEAGGPYGSDRS